MHNSTQVEIGKTVDCVYSLIKQRQLDIEFRKKHNDEIQKYKNELMLTGKRLELLQRENTQIKRQLGKCENDLLDMKQKIKANISDKKNSREDYKQLISKMEQKVIQVLHDIRKKENEFTKIQELYRKKTKDNFHYKNNFDTINRISNEGIESMYQHLNNEETAFRQLALMLREGYENTQRNIMDENAQLRECLRVLQEELASIINHIIENIKEKFPDKEVNCIESIYIKPIIFKTSVSSILNDVYQIIHENVCRIKDAVEFVITLSN